MPEITFEPDEQDKEDRTDHVDWDRPLDLTWARQGEVRDLRWAAIEPHEIVVDRARFERLLKVADEATAYCQDAFDGLPLTMACEALEPGDRDPLP